MFIPLTDTVVVGTYVFSKSSASIHTSSAIQQLYTVNNLNNFSANVSLVGCFVDDDLYEYILDIIASLIVDGIYGECPSLSNMDTGFTFLFLSTRVRSLVLLIRACNYNYHLNGTYTSF